jgi:hypothetical protein
MDVVERIVGFHVCVHERHSCGLNFHLRIEDVSRFEDQVTGIEVPRPDI